MKNKFRFLYSPADFSDRTYLCLNFILCCEICVISEICGGTDNKKASKMNAFQNLFNKTSVPQ